MEQTPNRRGLPARLLRSPAVALSIKGVKILFTEGPRTFSSRLKHKLFDRRAFAALLKTPLYTPEELEAQKKARFPQSILISVVVPLYNTPADLLRAMIRSVQEQTYAGWELCLADGSDEGHAEVGEICRALAKADARIRYQKLEKNLGISGNTNACLAMAKGAYVALLDHDDMLHPAALYEVMAVLCEQGADFIYTDEVTFHSTPEDAYFPHFKPDFAPDALRANNYICHLSVFRRSLLDETGGFDTACDGSQDHDLILRLTEKANRVVHIPKILYYWRAHPGSVAQSIGVKPYVIQAGVRAVEKQLSRLGLCGTVAPVKPGHTIYRVRYQLAEQPLVSILINDCEPGPSLAACLRTLFEKTAYPNYEVVVAARPGRALPANVRAAEWNGPPNPSAIVNWGVRQCRGDYVLLLANDARIITPEWIEELLMFAQRPDVGAVGAKLFSPGNTILHAGMGLLGGNVVRLFRGAPRSDSGYVGRLYFAQNLSAVSCDCMLIKRSAWAEAGGLDEALVSPFADVDLCLKMRRAGRLIVWTPFAELCRLHAKEHARGPRHAQAEALFRERWADALAAGDPYLGEQFARLPAYFHLR